MMPAEDKRCKAAALARSRPTGSPCQARRLHASAGMLVAAMLAGCVTTPLVSPDGAQRTPPAQRQDVVLSPPLSLLPPGVTPAAPQSDDARAGRRPGGYYLDDGPGDRHSAELDSLAALPDPVPIQEPLHPRANRPYRVLGNDYRPMTQREPFLQRGVASWYGRKFHGQLTSIGERYDMYGMTAAHPTLPIPSFALVTNLENGSRVVVRVNDRGPFLHDRVIDLSYLAAHKLGYVKAGSARVQVELLDPAPAAAAPALAAQPAGNYLQLGAFNARDNAEAAAHRLNRQLEWLQVPIQVTSSGVLHRVKAGPYRLREQAARAGAQVESRTGVRPVLLAR